MFQAPVKLISDERVKTLTIQQLRSVYDARLANWSRIAGYGSNTRAYLRRTNGTTWEEFKLDWLHGKIAIKAAEVPDVDDFLEFDDAAMDYEAIGRAMDDYEAAWLASHGERLTGQVGA